MTRRLAVLLLALAALGFAGCGGDDEVTGMEGANTGNGKELFVQNCASCHTLADAGTMANVGPNLDTALGWSCKQGFAEDTLYSVVLGQIDLAAPPMPADIVMGQDAVDVAAYVASVAGKDIEGCDPSGDSGTTTAETTTAETSG
ncbi:MAG: c-type cytochrome [Gaiellaceae bacterium]